MVHALLGASVILFVGWIFGMLGMGDIHLAWFMMVGAWWLLMAWCYAYYLTSERHHSTAVHPHSHFWQRWRHH